MTSPYLSADFLHSQTRIAVAVSGGPDSIALAHMLSKAAQKHAPDLSLHILTVNHNLRKEAKVEAESVKIQIKDFSPKIEHFTLTWDAPSSTRIQEDARNARYNLMADHCAAYKIPFLYVAHHLDDQIETFLFRLAKGSGLDGLGGMQELTRYNETLTIVRPLLHISKEELSTYCGQNNLSIINDPTNSNTHYARPRLRKSRKILEDEGLTSSRLATLITRINRAKEALQEITEEVYGRVVRVDNSVDGLVKIDLDALGLSPDEIGVRVLQKALTALLPPSNDYAPRFQKIETLFYDLKQPESFRKRTFAHLIFDVGKTDKTYFLNIVPEK